MRRDGAVEDVDEDWPPKDERAVGDEDGSRRTARGDLFNVHTEHQGPPCKQSGAKIDELLKTGNSAPRRET